MDFLEVALDVIFLLESLTIKQRDGSVNVDISNLENTLDAMVDRIRQSCQPIEFASVPQFTDTPKHADPSPLQRPVKIQGQRAKVQMSPAETMELYQKGIFDDDLIW